MSEQETAEGLRAFFNAMRDNFSTILAQGAGDPRLIDVLAAQAGDNYEKNAEIQSEGLPSPACCKGCDTCCCLQVAATAPEVFHAAHFIRLTAQAFAAHGVDLAKRLEQARESFIGKDQDKRFFSRTACPLIIGGACAIYAARPLACRGHVSFDVQACIAAAEGRDVEVPASQAHKTVRALVQNALQASLREAGLGWGAYEFLMALDRALQDPKCEENWRRGGDVFADLQLGLADSGELAATFDALKMG
ncbi:YkgJ family cysteine cluster protein [uncultured Rhodoblastus sp.]|uniref:YkgJ family cysteine cluster protein n=1 Tax=uncultured Rhodoblastus sp. TaxID=543037 RepID=UPI0025D29943|nr:YkgJ family cysteine cluster protein [uncultured Rhodoblastus sp.]